MHRRGMAIGLATALIMLVPSAAVAQATVPAVGARVRVTAPDLKIRAVPGTLVDVTSDTLSVASTQRGKHVRIPIDKLSRLEISEGKNQRLGIVRGAVSGLLFGGLIGLGVAGLSRGPGADGVSSTEDVAAIATFTGLGLIMGGVLGAAMAPERWNEVSLARPMNGHGSGGASMGRIGLSIAF